MSAYARIAHGCSAACCPGSASSCCLLAALVTGVALAHPAAASQQARIPGLTGPVDIGFDADGIPRIRAASDLDAAAALGFVHARDRCSRWT